MVLVKIFGWHGFNRYSMHETMIIALNERLMMFKSTEYANHKSQFPHSKKKN